MVNCQFFRPCKKVMVCLFCCIVFFVSNSGCSVKGDHYQEITHQKQKKDILNTVADLYPDQFKAMHRVILTLSGKDYVLNGYLSVNRLNRELKLIAQNDLGGIVFDVHYIENIKNKIHNNIRLIKNEWLEKSLLRDLKTLYLLEPHLSDTVFADRRGRFILSRKEGLVTKKMIFRPIKKQAQYRLREIIHLKNGKRIYFINFEYGKQGENSYPEFIFIKDTRMRYSLKIYVQYFML
ncbi:MAG: hypothetical protein L3J69_12085 [Desulfobacula sp.]|nr:hypothetical protein [Desulfobacula sp.]